MDTQEKTTCLPNRSKWAIFFPCTNASKNRTAELENHIRKMGYGCIRILGKWGCAKTEDTTFTTIDEESLFIPNMTYEEAISLGTKYDQVFVIIKDGNECKEICTKEFTTNDGTTYKKGDTLNVIVLSHSDFLNETEAKALFVPKAFSLLKTSTKKDLVLKELFEVEPPRASYFAKDVRYRKIL